MKINKTLKMFLIAFVFNLIIYILTMDNIGGNLILGCSLFISLLSIYMNMDD